MDSISVALAWIFFDNEDGNIVHGDYSVNRRSSSQNEKNVQALN